MKSFPNKVFIYALAAGILVAFVSIAVTAGAGGLDDAAHFTKQQRGAYLGLEFRWGGDRPVEKFLVIRGVVPRAGGAPFTAATGTRIQLSALSDLNPANWSRRNQILAVAGLGVAWWSITAEHRHSRTRGDSLPAALAPVDEPEPEPEPDDDSDSDSDGRRDHCTDGHGSDGEKNKHC